MSLSTSSSTSLQNWTALGVLLAVGCFVGWDATVRGRHVLAVSATYGVTVDSPEISRGGPTGYADGRRSLVLPVGASDTAQWIVQTQEMLAADEWRVRRVSYDNAPAGREVHWAAPFRWWLAGLAWVDRIASGRPVGQSVERAVIYSGPVMLAMVLAAVAGILFRKFGPLPAALFGVGAVATFPFYLDFVSGYADHHGVANLCGLLTVLCMAAGFRAEVLGGARRWFVASAVAGGAGLWISAATQIPVLVSLGAGLFLAGAVGRGMNPRPIWLAEPALFQWWGRVGGAVSVAAWLIEYFPRDFGWRLEVNHPLHALAWVGAGEGLRVVMLAWRDGMRGLSRRDFFAGAAGALAIAVLPLVVAFTAGRTFLVADPFLWRLHVDYISEFQGLAGILARGWSWTAVSLCLPVLLVVPAVVTLLRRSAPAGFRAQLAVVAVPAVAGWLMGWNQVRWLSLAFALLVPMLAVIFQGARARGAFFGVLAAGGLVFGPGLALNVWRTIRAGDFSTENIRGLAERDVAHWLRQRTGSGALVVAASPSVTNKLIFHGGATGVGTLYWENLTGLKHAAEFFAAPTPAAAQAMAARLGLTHVVFVSWGAFEASLVRLHRGLPESAPLPVDAFIHMLGGQAVPPPWLRAVPFKLPDHPALAGEHVRIWEIVPAQSPAEALAWATNYYLELGRMEPAAALAPALMRFEGDLSAMVMLAAIASRDQDREGFAAVFGRVRALLAQAPALPLNGHVHLVVVLAVGQRSDLAEAQLRAAMAKVDETSLRRLTLGTLTDLLALSEALKVPWPSPEIQRLARELVPPDQRKIEGGAR